MSLVVRLEDPFAPHIRGRSGLDSVRVDELCEISRRIFLKVRQEDWLWHVRASEVSLGAMAFDFLTL